MIQRFSLLRESDQLLFTFKSWLAQSVLVCLVSSFDLDEIRVDTDTLYRAIIADTYVAS